MALSGFYSRKHYPLHLRRIRFKDSESNKTLVFLTNLFDPPPTTIGALYKARWQVDPSFLPGLINFLYFLKRRDSPARNRMDSEIMTVREVAAYLKLTEKTVYRHAADGRIPGFKVGGAWRFRRSEIERWIKRQSAGQKKRGAK